MVGFLVKKSNVRVRINGDEITAVLIQRWDKDSLVEIDGETKIIENKNIVFKKDKLEDDINLFLPKDSLADEVWIMVQMSLSGENEFSQKIIYQEIRRAVGDCEVFFPWIPPKAGYDYPTVLFEGYVFIKDTASGRQYRKLSNSSLIDGPVAKKNGNVISWVSVNGHHIEGLKQQLFQKTQKTFKVGDEVRVLDGYLVNLTGTVIEVDKLVTVRFELHSKVMEEPLEPKHLEVVEF